MSSGTRKNWSPRAFPKNPQAKARLREWMHAEREGGLDAIGLDMSDADLSGGDFSESWFTDAKLNNTKLIGADLYRSDAEGTDFSGADLTEASLVRVNFDDAVFRGATLNGADLVKASLCDVDASHASLRGARLMGASLLDVNFCGADLSNAIVRENSFKVTLDNNTILEGMSGTLFGPIKVLVQRGTHEIGGADLEDWLRARGGDLRVLSSRRTKDTR